jgi:hypothetical protein
MERRDVGERREAEPLARDVVQGLSGRLRSTYLWIMGEFQGVRGPLADTAISQLEAGDPHTTHLQSWSVTEVRDVPRDGREGETFLWSGLSGCLASLVVLEDSTHRHVVASHYLPRRFDPSVLYTQLKQAGLRFKPWRADVRGSLARLFSSPQGTSDLRAGALIVDEPSCSAAVARETAADLRGFGLRSAQIKREHYRNVSLMRGGLVQDPGLLIVRVPPTGDIVFEGQMGAGIIPLLPLTRDISIVETSS